MFENKNKTNKQEPISDNLIIKKMRLIRGMSRNEAALIFSYSRSSIERIENGRSQLTKDKIQKFVEGYGFKMQEFINLKLGKSSDTIVPENPVK
ncbi:MAG: helix-turn-helix transcriptional regulator, partial [Bdellovibrionales bacterium]|nr:helix-turn-helix transcriptional regulator [Bdellovibrionales bacterium]